MSIKAIFQEGMKERKRKKSLGKVSGELRDKEKVHGAQLAALGQKAWEAKTDISAFPEVKAGLLDAQKALDELRDKAEQLHQQKEDAEADKKRESDRLGAAVKEAEERKRGTDGRLLEQKDAQQSGLKETQKAAGRLASIAKERALLQNKNEDPATTEAEKGEIAKGMDLLAREEAELQAANRGREEAGQPVAAALAALQEESSQMQKQLEGLRGEMKRVLGDMDKKISALHGELSKNSEKAKEAENRQKGEFRRLGEKLAAATSMDPNLAKEMAAVLNARTEMEGVQSFISGLERQKDEGQVSAYKKMMAILIGGAVLLAVIIVALVLLLSPKKKENPFGGLAGESGTAARSMEELAQQIQKGFGGIKAESEKIQGKKIELATEAAMKAALPQVGGWQLQNAHYGQGAFGDLETASLHARYVAGDDTVYAEITDAGTASALLVPLKTVFSLNMRVDNADVLQRTSTINGIPVAERIDKRDNEATFGIIYKDRYLIELRTRAAKGLELLREFAAKLDLSKLQP